MGNKSFRESRERVIFLDPENEGESPIYRSGCLSNGQDLVETYDPEVHTLYEALMKTVNTMGNLPALGTRYNDGPFEWVNYSVAWEKALSFGSGLVGLGQTPGVSKIGIYMNNNLEWILTDWGSIAYNFTVVPLYDTLGPDSCNFILNQADVEACVCSPNHTLALLNGETPGLRIIIQVGGEFDEEVKALAAEKNINLLFFDDVEKSGKESPVDVVPPSPEDVYTLCYTSGTTGDPKGVILTHRNFVSLSGGIRMHGVVIKSSDVHISYLPLAHVFERCTILNVFIAGASAGFFRGNVLTLFDDIQEIKPTIFPSVPRLYNRIYDKVLSKARQGGLSETIFNTALESKLDNLKAGYHGHSIWDSLVFGKVAGQLGGRVRMMMTGSAPISAEVLSFLRVSMSCPVLEGYGQTESCGASVVNMVGDTEPGHVGVPLPCCDVKLVDVPDMDYFTSDENPRGEICFRGPSCSPGYYKNPEKTAELIDEQGWTHSGDIGEWLPNNSLKIIDRKKNIFKLAQGEYIAPEKLENIYVLSHLIAQIFVHGDSLKSKLVAIVVPDADTAKEWAAERGLGDLSLEELCHNDDFHNAVAESINREGQEADVRGFERIADFRMVSEMFTVENDLLTPTFKLKRPQAQKKYQSLFDEMYEHLD